jgi:uncharacterized membrane protein
MPKIARTLVGFGFLWMSLWATFGALMGAKLNNALLTEDNGWLGGLQRSILNIMSLVLIALGLTYVAARRRASEKTLVACAMSTMGGTIVFGLGLVCESFFPPQRGAIPWASAITALGGIVYILAVGLWGLVFLGRSRHDQPDERITMK